MAFHQQVGRLIEQPERSDVFRALQPRSTNQSTHCLLVFSQRILPTSHWSQLHLARVQTTIPPISIRVQWLHKTQGTELRLRWSIRFQTPPQMNSAATVERNRLDLLHLIFV